MDDPIGRYLELRRQLAEAETRVTDLSARLGEVSRGLSHSYWRATKVGAVDNQRYQTLTEVMRGGRQRVTIDLSDWPAASAIEETLIEAQRLDKESREAWNAIPTEHRTALEAPRSPL